MINRMLFYLLNELWMFIVWLYEKQMHDLPIVKVKYFVFLCYDIWKKSTSILLFTFLSIQTYVLHYWAYNILLFTLQIHIYILVP